MKNKSIEKESELILRGLEKAYEKLVKFKIEKNSPLIVSKDGEILEIRANEILPTTIYIT